MSEEKCEICRTVLNIHGCLNCGAPVCCLKCCMDDTHPPKDNPLSGLPAGALDGGWTYAGMNRYALGLENKCAELEAKLNARAIEQEALIAEATKLSKFLNETESKEPFDAREVTGKQEPIAIVRQLVNTRILDVTGLRGYDNLPDGSPMFATQQPCQRCAELEKEAEYYRLSRDKFAEESRAKVAELTELNQQLSSKGNSYLIDNARLAEKVAYQKEELLLWDKVIDDHGIAVSCINPRTDLINAIKAIQAEKLGFANEVIDLIAEVAELKATIAIYADTGQRALEIQVRDMKRIKELEAELAAAYLEMRKIRPSITALYDRDVWIKANRGHNENN